MKITKKEIKQIEEIINIHWIEALTEDQKTEYVYFKWFYDIEFFTDYFLSHYKQDKKTRKIIKTPKFHKEIWNSVNKKDTLIIIPRDHWKSTSLFFYLVWNVCYQVDPEILLVMWEWLWVSTIWKIREEFEENSLLKSIFWRLVPGRNQKEANKEWTKKRLQFLSWIKIMTVSFGGRIRWLRPTLILVDDPQEDDSVQNKQITDKFNNWFFNTVYNTLDDSWRCIVVWTVIW